MAAEHEGAHVFHRDVEFVGEKIAQARGVEHAGHADHHLLGQAGGFLQSPDHGIERVGDADHERVGCVFAQAGADLVHHLKIDAEQVVAAHAGLARHAGGDDAHIGAFDRLVGIDARHARVEALDRRGLHQVERFALRDAFGNVEQNHIAEFFEANQVGERAADLAGADQCNLGTRHVGEFPLDGLKMAANSGD